MSEWIFPKKQLTPNCKFILNILNHILPKKIIFFGNYRENIKVISNKKPN